MLKQEILDKMSLGENKDYTNLAETYWSYVDQINEMIRCPYGHESNLTIEDLKRIEDACFCALQNFESRMRDKYI